VGEIAGIAWFWLTSCPAMRLIEETCFE